MAIDRNRAALLVVAALALVTTAGRAAAAPAAMPAHATVEPPGPRTSVPFGWVDFCNRYGAECDVDALPAADIELTPAAFREIDRVNRGVNAAIKPVTDMDHWGVVDRWDYPTDGRGDCEDYALLKRRLLMRAGLPRQALLITVVKDHEGEGHAILTVKTSRGDYVLDNLDDRVLPWTETGYKFVKRQSQENPNLWQSIGAPGGVLQTTAR